MHSSRVVCDGSCGQVDIINERHPSDGNHDRPKRQSKGVELHRVDNAMHQEASLFDPLCQKYSLQSTPAVILVVEFAARIFASPPPRLWTLFSLKNRGTSPPREIAFANTYAVLASTRVGPLPFLVGGVPVPVGVRLEGRGSERSKKIPRMNPR